MRHGTDARTPREALADLSRPEGGVMSEGDWAFLAGAVCGVALWVLGGWLLRDDDGSPRDVIHG